MGIDNDWLLENLSGSYSLGAVDDAVDSLIGEYDTLIDKITDDKRNYMLEAVSTMKEKIITSRVENVLELIDSTQFTDGDEFRVIGTGITVTARKYIDGETGSPAWTIEKIEQAMSGSFEEVSKIETAAVPGGYSSVSNSMTKKDLAETRNAIASNTDTITVPFAELETVATSDGYSILDISTFITRYIPALTEGQIDLVKLNIASELKSVKVSVSNVSFIEHNMTDGELKGSGSKITDYTETTAASSASPYSDTLHVVLNYADDYVVNVGGVDYTYSASDFETAEDVAAGIEGELGNDTSLNVSTDTGYWSKVFQNGNGDRVFGWYAENTDDGVSYEVQMIVPTGVADFGIEQDGVNPEKIIITFEHDGFDPVYPPIADIRDAVNAFADVDIRVVVMPGFSDGDEYNTADNVTLEQGASKIVIESAQQQTITVSTAKAHKTKLVHNTDFSAATAQIGVFEVVKFNPTNTYSVTIGGQQLDLDPSANGNESVVDETSLAQKIASMVNAAALGVVASSTGTIVTIVVSSAGSTITVSNSGEFNYVQPISRDTLLRYDIRNIPNVNASTISQLRKSGNVVTSKGEPLNKTDVSKLSTSGIVYSDSFIMFPQVPTLVDETENFVQKIGRSAVALEQTVKIEKEKIATAGDLVSPIVRSMAKPLFPLYSTDQAKSSRWFFVEAGANSLAARSTIGIALSTIAPKDYEKLVLKDDNATFSSVREKRLPSVGQNYESIISLLSEKTQSYNASGQKAIIPIPSDIVSSNMIDIIEAYLTKVQLDGFIKFALLPQIVSGDEFMKMDKLKAEVASIFSTLDLVGTIVSVSDKYRVVVDFEDLEPDVWAIRDAFTGTTFEVEHVVPDFTWETKAPFPSTDIIEHTGTRYVIKPEIMNSFIILKDPDSLYKALLELTIQIDDSLMEQRFIALAGSYVIDASKVLELYADELFASYVFGVNEAETPPENNYGLGGIPIDATVTMSKLYFRNMRNQALPKPEKRYAMSTELTLQNYTKHLYRKVHIGDVDSRVDIPWRAVLTRRVYSGRKWVNVTTLGNKTEETINSFHIEINSDSPVEDRVYREIARTGYFSSNIDLGLNHLSTGISTEFKDSVWNILIDAIEIADDGSIVSINSAKSYLQALYQGFERMTQEQFGTLLLGRSAYFELEDEEQDDIYSPITTLFLKILLYFKDKKATIAYANWNAEFDKILGLLFMDDEFEEEILSYEAFLLWVGAMGAMSAFSWESSLSTDILAIAGSVDMDGYKEAILRVETAMAPDFESVNENSYSTTISMSNVDGFIIPTINIVAINVAPVADAGPDKTGTTSVTFELNGSASTDANTLDTLTYIWTIETDPSSGTDSIVNSGEKIASFTPSTAGTYTIKLVVSDGTLSSEDTATYTIS